MKGISMANTKPERISFLSGEDADNQGCERFCKAMKHKLARKRAQGRGGWNDPKRCSIKRLEKMLREHVEKGDPTDAGNIAMMIWNRRNPTGTKP
jgi:hypothetical protein